MSKEKGAIPKRDVPAAEPQVKIKREFVEGRDDPLSIEEMEKMADNRHIKGLEAIAEARMQEGGFEPWGPEGQEGEEPALLKDPEPDAEPQGAAGPEEGEEHDETPPPPEGAEGVGDKPPATPAPEKPAEDEVEVVINGVRQKVPKSRVMDAGVRSLQKQMAADETLETAKRLLSEVQALKQAPAAVAPPQGTPPPHQPAEDVKRLSKELADASQYGTAEEIQAAYEKLLTAVMPQQAPAVDAEAIAKQVRERIRQEEQAKAHQTIRARFEGPVEDGGFADIAADPQLYQLASIRAGQLIAAGATDSWETYERAGKEIRMLAGKPTPAQPAPKTPPQSRAERKRHLDVVRGAHMRQPITAPSDKPMTREEEFAELNAMRARRGA